MSSDQLITQISTTAIVHAENDASIESTKTISNSTHTSSDTICLNVPVSPLQRSEQVLIKDTAEINFIEDTLINKPSDETETRGGAEVEEIHDVEPNRDDSLNDSSINDTAPDIVKESKPDQKTEKVSQFPLGRVRDIMKADPDIKIVSAECVFLVAKATEMFLQRLGQEIHAVTLRNKKKTLQKKDLDAVILENGAFEFLEEALN